MSETIVPDSEHRGLVARLPRLPRDLAQLARFDRPIGWWLLFWPCAWGVWLTGQGVQWQLVLWLLLGAIAMRGAGCVYNDIVDADLDRQVARTASRPVASRRVSARAAWTWLAALCGVGLVVLFQLRLEAQLVALASLALVAAYPFMKRVTWWPTPTIRSPAFARTGLPACSSPPAASWSATPDAYSAGCACSLRGVAQVRKRRIGAVMSPCSAIQAW